MKYRRLEDVMNILSLVSAVLLSVLMVGALVKLAAKVLNSGE